MPSPKHQHRRRKHRAFHPPPSFWEKLTKVWLTKSALREADRRNKPLSLSQSSSPSLYTHAPDFLSSCSASCLEKIRKLSRYGGPDLSDIRDYPAPAHFSQYSTDPTNSSSKQPTHTQPKTRNTTFYDRNFEDHLTDHGVFMPSSRYPDGTEPSEAENIAEIRRRLRAPRPSVSLSEGSLEKEYKEFTKINNRTPDSQGVIKKILPILEGPQQSSHHDAGNHPLTNFAPLTDGTLASAQPNVYHGAHPNQLDPKIRDQLSDKIIPTTQSNRPITPNFFVEAKGHDGPHFVLRRQALYDGALGARAMHSLQRFGQEGSSNRPNDYDNNAYALTSTFQTGTLGIYATHPARSRNDDRPTDYTMTQVGQWALHGDPETYQRGLNAYRNSRDLAKEYRDEFIRQANERYAAGQDRMMGS